MSASNLRQGLALITDPNVGKLFIAYLISYSGTAMAPIAMAFGVLELTGSTADASFVIAAPTLASIVILLLGGVVADRTSRKRVIFLAELVAMAAQVSMGLLFITGHASVPLLTLLMLVNGAAIAFHSPASTGLIVQLVAPHQLQATNALLGMARHGALAIGAALGGVLVATIGPGLTLFFDGLTFGVSAILVFFMRPNSQVIEKSASIFADLKSGWHEFTSHTWLWTMVLQFAVLLSALEAFFGLIGPAFTLEHLGGARDWGFIAASFGIGTFMGGFIAMRIHPRHPMRFAVFCSAMFAALPLAMLVESGLPTLMFLAFLTGVADQQFTVIWMTTFQTRVPAHMLSRVGAYDHMGSIILAPLGLVVAGILNELFGFQFVFSIMLVVILVPTALVLLVRDVWSMQADKPNDTDTQVTNSS